MTTRWPSAVSSLYKSHRNAGLRLSLSVRVHTGHLSSRTYSDRPHEKAALHAQTTPKKTSDLISPPISTLPPPLKLPERSEFPNIAVYYYRIGRAYGSFYWVGIKAVWFNYKATKALKERVGTDVEKMTRAEFQLLSRNNYDIGKLPFFGLLVCLFGEWLPMIVPFIPSAVPGTCRIPKQIRGMRVKAEERRNGSYRKGVGEPTREQLESKEKEKEEDGVRALIDQLRDDQLYHLSCTLNNHNRLWDRVQLPPPSALLRRGLTKKLTYIATDDALLLRDGRGDLSQLSMEEVMMACEERGMDVLGKKEKTLRDNLLAWLGRQRDDRRRGTALFMMLFRRPNAWSTKVNGKS